MHTTRIEWFLEDFEDLKSKSTAGDEEARKALLEFAIELQALSQHVLLTYVAPITEEPVRTTKISEKNQHGEYRVRLYIDGEYQEFSDYFTDSKEDAENTAKHMRGES